MKVILNSDVANLGEEGDICNVAPGYARNYLLPKGLVLEYNPRNIALLEERRADIERRKAEKRKEASTVKERIEAEPMKISMTAGANGKLFGSVGASTIAERLAADGIEIERKKIDVPEKSIKTVGNFKVKIRLYGDEEAVLTVSVEASNAREIEAEKAKEADRGEEAAPADEQLEENDANGDEDAADTDGEYVPAADEDLDPEVIAMMQAAEVEASADTNTDTNKDTDTNTDTADVEADEKE